MRKQVANVSAVVLYSMGTIRKLHTVTKELAMDETYGTNSAGIRLFAVLAEARLCHRQGVSYPLEA